MDDDFFKYLVVTDQLDEFLGLEEKESEEEMTDEEDEDDYDE